MEEKYISAASNKKIKQVQALLQKGKARRETGCFVAEGRHLFDEVPADRLVEIYAARSYADQIREAVTAGAGQVKAPRSIAKNVPLYIVEDRLFDRISDTKTPQGVLCVVRMDEPDTEALIKAGSPLFFLLDQIRDPGNLGTIIRAGEAAGVTGIWLTDGCADPYQPKVVRSAMGALYRMPVVRLSASGSKPLRKEDMTLDVAVERWREAGISLYGTSLQADMTYDEPDYRAGCAFVIGNESHGVRDEVLALCDETVIIPMQGRVESLNAAIAASLMAFEAARQRRAQSRSREMFPAEIRF